MIPRGDAPGRPEEAKQVTTIRGNAVIGQSGGPTAVINQSLVGVIEGLRDVPDVGTIYAMRHGVTGLVRGDLIDMTDMPGDVLERLARTPSAGAGSTRDKPDETYCKRILETCRANKIRYFFYIGGNDSSDTCRIVNELANHAGYELRCFHVPKTVDNDLVLSDHTPGYPSAARFVAKACMADFMDNISLPGIKINVVMGRNAGFLTAASALARRQDRAQSTDGPQLVYVPEVAFDTDRFVDDVARIFDAKGRCHIAVSEGIQDAQGRAIGATLIEGAQRDDHGNVQLSGSGALGDLLANLLKRKLTPAGGKPPRVRADTFGYIQRCWPEQSEVDASEARGVGRFAAELAASGNVDGSIAIERTSKPGEPYASTFNRVDLEDVAAKTRHMPPEFLEGHCDVSQAFIDYATPLVGELPTFERF
jgi:6-phosphofructokinase 1